MSLFNWLSYSLISTFSCNDYNIYNVFLFTNGLQEREEKKKERGGGVVLLSYVQKVSNLECDASWVWKWIKCIVYSDYKGGHMAYWLLPPHLDYHFHVPLVCGMGLQQNAENTSFCLVCLHTLRMGLCRYILYSFKFLM